MENESRSARSAPPRWLQAIGWLSLPGVFALVLRLVYEQTVLTWRDGEQMVGFALAHVYTGLLVWGVLSVIVGIVYLLLIAAVSTLQRFRGERLHSNVVPTVGLVMLFGVLLIPYEIWMVLGVRLGVAQNHQAEYLVHGAGSGHKYLVNAVLRNGVPVDATESSSTALNAACANKDIEMARYLISKGADLKRAPECQVVPELGGKVRPQVPSTTIEVRP